MEYINMKDRNGNSFCIGSQLKSRYDLKGERIITCINIKDNVATFEDNSGLLIEPWKLNQESMNSSSWEVVGI